VLPTYLILNPRSGRGRSEELIPSIRGHFKAKNIPFDLHVTMCQGDATKVAAEMSKHYPIVVAAGGDGTVNEVVNGIAGTDCALGILPLGSGNDFARTLAYSKRLSSSLQSIARQSIKTIDLGYIEVVNASGRTTEKFFINSVGIGLDAQVAHEAGRISWVRGLAKYGIAAIKVLASYKAGVSTAISPEFESTGKHLLISIGNGKSSGGGFFLTPDAILDDGMLDVCLAKNLSMSEILRIFPFVLIGRHGRFGKIELKRTKKLSVASNTDLPVHVDGEVLGLDIREVRLEVKAAAIKVLVP